MKKIIKFSMEKILAKKLDEIFKFKDKELGKSCYIFGDGPSIKWFDLRNFSDRDVITLSAIPLHRDSHFLNIKYCLLTETWYFYRYFLNPSWSNRKLKLWKNEIKKHYIKYFLENTNINCFVSLTSFPVLRNKNINYIYRELPDKSCPFYNELRLENLHTLSGSFVNAIILATFMGYKDIILVGCDYTHSETRSLHWYERGEGVATPMVDYNSKFLSVINKYVNIDTITLKGRGNVLPGIEYQDYTGSQPSFKENYQLMSSEILSDFAKWLGYNI